MNLVQLRLCLREENYHAGRPFGMTIFSLDSWFHLKQVPNIRPMAQAQFQMYTVSGGSKRGSKFFQFHSFLGKISKIVCWRLPWRVGAPSSGNPGSATDSGTVILLHSFEILVDDLRGGDQEGPQIIY